MYLGRLTSTEGFDRLVAIKRAHPEVARDPELAAMFLDEASLAGRIRHPNVVAALDLVDRDGELWLIMEYVHGLALASLIRTGGQSRRVPPPIACAIAAGMLRGLHAAHETKGPNGEELRIVHRDVSPQNVLVGVDGVPRIIDFGVARSRGQRHLTRVGQIKGKLAYFAPEFLRGAEPDRRVDVFAAAIVLWEMLTGNRFIDGTNEAELLVQALSPAVYSPRDTNPEVAEELAQVVLRGLHENPGARFQTALEMAQAVESATVNASPHEVAEWVEANGALLLERRARSLARAEGYVLPAQSLDDPDVDAPSHSHGRDKVSPPFSEPPAANSQPPTVIVPLELALDARKKKRSLASSTRIRRGGMAIALLAIMGFVVYAATRDGTDASGTPTPVVTSVATSETAPAASVPRSENVPPRTSPSPPSANRSPAAQPAQAEGPEPKTQRRQPRTTTPPAKPPKVTPGKAVRQRLPDADLGF